MATPSDQSQGETTGGESLVCDLCDRTVDTPLSKCIDCDVDMCVICTKGHTRVKETSSHQIVTDQDTRLLRSTSKNDQSNYCVDHAEENVGFYCFTCKKLICSICITSNHTNHQCSVIKHATQEISKELSKSLTEMKENKMAGLSLKIQEVETMKVENNSNGDSNVRMITDRMDNFVNQINQIGENLLQEDRQTTQQNNQYLTNILENLKTEHLQLENTCTEYTNILTTGTGVEIINAWIDSEPRLSKVLPPEDEVNIHLCKFIAGKTDISSIKSSFGSFDDENGSDFCSDSDGPILKIRNKSVPTLQPKEKSSAPPLKSNLSESKPTKSLQQTPPPSPVPTLQPKEKSSAPPLKSNLSESKPTKSLQQTPPPSPVTRPKAPKPPEAMKKNEKKSFRIDGKIQQSLSFTLTKTCIFNICPITDTSMLFRFADHYDNYIVDKNGKTQGKVQLDFQFKDMAKIGDYLFATDFDNKIIYKLNTSGMKIQEINIALIHPLRLCGSSDGTLLVTMADAWSYNIKKDSRRYLARLKLSGREIDSYEYDNEGNRMFTLPSSVAENVNGDICVLNRLSDSRTNVVILDNKGRLKVTYRGGPNRSEFDGRRLICDKYGHVIVTDRIYSSVHLLDSKGVFIQYLTMNKDVNGLPVSLAIDIDGRLWIGCDEGIFLIMKYIHKN